MGGQKQESENAGGTAGPHLRAATHHSTPPQANTDEIQQVLRLCRAHIAHSTSEFEDFLATKLGSSTASVLIPGCCQRRCDFQEGSRSSGAGQGRGGGLKKRVRTEEKKEKKMGKIEEIVRGKMERRGNNKKEKKKRDKKTKKTKFFVPVTAQNFPQNLCRLISISSPSGGSRIFGITSSQPRRTGWPYQLAPYSQ